MCVWQGQGGREVLCISTECKQETQEEAVHDRTEGTASLHWIAEWEPIRPQIPRAGRG